MALLHSARYQQSLRRYHARGVRSRDLQVGDLVLRLQQDACWGRASVRRRSHTKKQLRPKSFLRDGRRSLFMELRRFKPT
jgi:hypothetical protein